MGRTTWVVTAVTVVVLVLAAVLLRVAWSHGSLNGWICGGECGPDAVAPPVGLKPARAGAQGVEPVATTAVDRASIRAVVAKAVSDRSKLGTRVGVTVIAPGDAGKPVVDQGPDVLVPASTTKLLTSFAALSAIDPQHRFATRVVRSGDRLTLVGGGDPYLVRTRVSGAPRVEHARLSDLAVRTARALKASGSGSVRLQYDTSLFSGPAASDAWEDDYVSGGVVTPVSPLWVNEGRLATGGRAADAAQDAADAFAAELRRRGVDVSGTPREAKAARGAREVARVESGTLAQIVESLVLTSDNEAAEVVLRHVGLARDEPGSFDGGTRAVRDVLEARGVDVDGLVLHDGSGLSRKNRIAPRTLAEVLALAPAQARTSSLVTDLPVGGFSGTLKSRFADAGVERGSVRAKTGTLTGVHAIAGVVTTRRGVPLAFALMTDATTDINPFVTQAALDDLATALAATP